MGASKLILPKFFVVVRMSENHSKINETGRTPIYAHKPDFILCGTRNVRYSDQYRRKFVLSGMR